MLSRGLRRASARILFDTFTGSNGTAIASHVPNVQRTPGSYRTITTYGSNPVVQIQSNIARANSGGINTGVTVIETLLKDVTIICDVNKGGTNALYGGTGLAFRFSGSAGYTLDYFNGMLRLSKNNGLSGTQLTTASFSFSTTQTYSMKVVLKGNSIKCYMDGTLYIDTSDSTYGGTEHGFGSLAGNFAYSTADNLAIYRN